MRTELQTLVGLVLAGTLLVTGCSSTSQVTGLGTVGIAHHTAASLKHSGRNYMIVGLVHAQDWQPTMYWATREQGPQRAVSLLEREAKRLGADAVVDVRTKSENHYQFAIVLILVPFVFCHEEWYASATAVKFVD